MFLPLNWLKTCPMHVLEYCESLAFRMLRVASPWYFNVGKILHRYVLNSLRKIVVYRPAFGKHIARHPRIGLEFWCESVNYKLCLWWRIIWRWRSVACPLTYPHLNPTHFGQALHV